MLALWTAAIAMCAATSLLAHAPGDALAGWAVLWAGVAALIVTVRLARRRP